LILLVSLYTKKEEKMKKLTSLQILILMNLSICSLQINGVSKHSFPQDNAPITILGGTAADGYGTGRTRIDMQQALLPQATQLRRILVEEMELEDSLHSIQDFVSDKYEEIKDLLRQKVAAQAEIERLEIQLIDAQTMFEEHTMSHQDEENFNHERATDIERILTEAHKGLTKVKKNTEIFAKTVIKSGKRLGQQFEDYELGQFFTKKKHKSEQTGSVRTNHAEEEEEEEEEEIGIIDEVFGDH